jgi:LuxR family maltose regulon positive regulatory protein
MLCAPLCNEVLDAVIIPPETIDGRFVISGRTSVDPLRIDSRAVLEYLDRSNLFIVPLDSTRQWYRYNHLFRDMLVYWLQTRHTAEEIAGINRRAASWYARNGQVDVAVRQLLAAGAAVEAADLIEVNISSTVGRVPWPALQQLLSSLPDDVVAQRPILILARAWLMWVLQRYDLLPNMLHQAEVVLNKAELEYGEQRSSWLQGWIDALWSIVHMLNWNFEKSLARSEDALARVPPTCGYVRGVTIVYYLADQQFLGRREEALAYCAHALANELDDSTQRVAIAQACWPSIMATWLGL